jgi:hypothetical protein
MTACDRICADAVGLAALPPDDPERAAAVSHASGCARCTRALREATRLQALLAAAAPQPLPATAFEGAYTAIRDELRREARRRRVATAVGVCVCTVVLIGLGRSRSSAPADWLLAAALWATSLVVAAASMQAPRLAGLAAVLAALGAAALSGAGGPLAPTLGMECVVTELASAAIVVGAVWLVVRGGTTSPARTAIAAVAAAGALAGNAALQVTCAAHTAVPHALAFHVGGVLFAMVAATLLWPRARAHADASSG